MHDNDNINMHCVYGDKNNISDLNISYTIKYIEYYVYSVYKHV